MRNRLQSRWISFKGAPILGINLDGFESDGTGVRAEIEAVEAILGKQEPDSLLVVLDIALTDMMPELLQFIQAHSGQPGDPIRKLAIVGVSRTRRIWYRLTQRISWPKQARFFDEHEKAKSWLITENF